MSEDMVNHPPHYKSHPSGVEVIEITEHMNFCLGNVIKYVLRSDHKGTQVQDLEKAKWYLEREIDRLKGDDPDDEEDYTAEEFFDIPFNKEIKTTESDFLDYYRQ